MKPASECRADARLRPVLGSSPAAPDRAGTSSRPSPHAGPPAMPPGPAPRSQRSSPRPHPERPHCREPARRRGAGCPPCRSCRRAHRSGRRAPPSPCNRASSEGSGSSQGVVRLIANHLHLTIFESAPEVRVLCSAGVTRPRRSYDPVRHPLAAALRDVEAATLTNNGSPPTDVPCPLPRRIERVRVSIASPPMQPSPNGRRVGIRLVTFEMLWGTRRGCGTVVAENRADGASRCLRLAT